MSATGAEEARAEQVVTIMLEPPPPPEEPPAPPPPPESEPLKLGLDAQTPPSDTWLGFLDFLKHAGPLAEVEQASFVSEPAGAESNTPPQQGQRPVEASAAQPEQATPMQPPDAPLPPIESPSNEPLPEQPREPAANTPQESRTPEEVPPDAVQEQPVEPTPAPSRDVPPELTDPQITTPPEEPIEGAGRPDDSPLEEPAQKIEPIIDSSEGELPMPLEGPTPAEAVQWIQSIHDSAEQAKQQLAPPVPPPPAPRETSQPQEESQPAPSPNAQPTPPNPLPQPSAQPQPAIPQQPPPGPRGDGELSDRESDPSSTIEVPKEQWERGRPIASPGLELKPRKPHFTILTMITSAPCNPLCEITFAADGVPTRARLLSGSCDARIDEGILNSLYGWRASGERLKNLPAGQTITVEIRLILTRRK